MKSYEWPKGSMRTIVGCVLVGTLLPFLLASFHSRSWLCHWTLAALLINGPFIATQSWLFYDWLARHGANWTLLRMLLIAAVLSLPMGFVFLLGWGHVTFFVQRAYHGFSSNQCLALFVVNCIVCGLWCGWRAYKALHQEAHLQYSLRTLLLAVLAAGTVLGLFAPR